MSTDYHTQIAVGANINAATINNPLGELDAAIGDVDNPSVQPIVAHTTFSAAIASIDLTSIPDTFTRLRLILTLRSDRAANIEDDVDIYFNNDAVAANYYTISQRRYNNAGAIASTFHENLAGVGAFRVEMGASAANSPAGWISCLTLEILQYADETDFKTFILTGYVAADTGAGDQYIIDGGGIWLNNSDAIDQITIIPVAGANFDLGSYKLEGIL